MSEDRFKQDRGIIEKTLQEVLGKIDIENVERMNGLTNRTYKVEVSSGKAIVVRIPGEGTEDMICREDERKSTELACKIGIDTELIYFGEDGVKIMHYIEGAETFSAERLREEENIHKVADIFRILHNCGEDTGVLFEVFDMAANYEKVIEQYHINMYEDYREIKDNVMKIKEIIDGEEQIKKVPCHNDSLCENWVYGEEKLHLIDWEYAGMNDPMWDLADISIEASYSEEQDLELLSRYFEGEPTLFQKRRFMANKLYLDYLWTLWGKTRVPFDGEEMEQYALERYIRLKDNIKKYREIFLSN